jgi:hypothetical protein
MICVFIYELVLNAKQQGSPFSFKVSERTLLRYGERYQSILACRKSYVGPIVKCINFRRRSFPALYEIGRLCTTVDAVWL